MHHQQVAREIRDEYVDTMSKIYSAYFGGYIAKLMKLQVCVIICRFLVLLHIKFSLFGEKGGATILSTAFAD